MTEETRTAARRVLAEELIATGIRAFITGLSVEQATEFASSLLTMIETRQAQSDSAAEAGAVVH